MNNTQCDFLVRFWGVRGSIPCPGPDTLKYGGNTSCVEMRAGRQLFIFDAGTGIRNLGKALMGSSPFTAHIFFSHLHWDHIQGLPFFEPAFVAGNQLFFYGARGPNSVSLGEYLMGQMRDPHFPVPMTHMSATLQFQELNPNSHFSIEDVVIRTFSLNHPGQCLGYRVEYDGLVFSYATDTERFGDDINENVLELARGADLLVYDAMYTDEEYVEGKKGWGHSTWQEALRVASAAQVKRVALFHHDPSHTDAFLEAVHRQALRLFPGCLVAQEGMEIQLR